MAPRRRLGLFVGGLVALGLAVAVVRPLDRDGAEALFAGLGWAALPAFVVGGALLASAFVPGALLAAAAGLLFGTVLGFAASVASAALTAVLAVGAARRAGRPGVEQLDDRRLRAVERLLGRRPVAAVVLQRLLPGVPDAPSSYLFGLAGLAAWQVVAGTLIGSSPRALSYAILGDAAGTGDGTQAVVGVLALVVTGLVGLALGWAAWRRDVRRRTGQGRNRGA